MASANPSTFSSQNINSRKGDRGFLSLFLLPQSLSPSPFLILRNSFLECFVACFPPTSISQSWVVYPYPYSKGSWESKFNFCGRRQALLERKKCGKMDTLCSIGINIFPNSKNVSFHKVSVSPICCDMSSLVGYIIFLSIYSSMSIEIYFRNVFCIFTMRADVSIVHTHFSGRRAISLTHVNLGGVVDNMSHTRLYFPSLLKVVTFKGHLSGSVA